MSERAVHLPANEARDRLVAGRARLAGMHKSLFVQLLAAFLLASVPAIATLAILLTRQEQATLSQDVQAASSNVVHAATSKLEVWMGERASDLRSSAAHLSGGVGDPGLSKRLAALIKADKDGNYDLLEVTDPAGAVVASTSPQLQLDVG